MPSKPANECPLKKTLIDLPSEIQDTKWHVKSWHHAVMPAVHALRKLWGGDLALARRKRGFSTSDMASRLFVSRDTLWRLERGDPAVALGSFGNGHICSPAA